MRGFTKKLVVFFMMMTIILVTGRISVSADGTANVSISSPTVTQGSNVTVKIVISSSRQISNYELHIVYDKDILEYQSGASGGGSGEIVLMSTTETYSDTYNVVFKGKAAGTSTVSVKSPQPTGAGVFDLNFVTDPEMVISGGSGTVTVAALSSASSNANLSSLKVSSQTESGTTKTLSISPDFSADITKYYLTLEDDVEKLVVSATAKDSKAKTTVSGTTISPGNNVTTITVTAEDGTAKKYYIYSSQGNASVDVNQDGLSVQIGDTLMEVSSSLEGVELPAGFSKTVIGYNSINIEAAYNDTKGLNLLYLTSEDGTAAGFYIYNIEDGSLYKYQTILVGNATYILMKVDDTVVIPENFKRTTLTINGQEVDGWISDNNQEFGLVYAMNDTGVTNLYMYDFKEGTMQRMNQNLFLSLTSQEIEALENSEVKANEMKNRMLWVILGLGAALIAVFVLLMLKMAEGKNQKVYENPEEDHYLLNVEETKDVESVTPLEVISETKVKEPVLLESIKNEAIELEKEVFEKPKLELEEEIEEYRVVFNDEEIFDETEGDIEEDSGEYTPDYVEDEEEEISTFEDMKSRIFQGFDDDDDDIEVIDLDDEN